ncbi:site-specific DNA-methyltransferase [Pseudactinotalea sp. HY158]|uniref:DNA-methyltransferase n=1 Tax=Pseudactinotalea sp. HY158 TaxID=2654547 RepID=UPI00129CDB2A|nr:site-specific DNA-methyltransferase [Pseudactinotalea sp. HY158]QGH68683.1 site-specific DNA-methyltransferase [Pseudactinotalea sp. HY158]
MSRLPRNQVLVGDARERLTQLPEGSVDCVITSPPYFRLRDYGHAGQLGLEDSVGAYVTDLVGLCSEAARLLTPTGTLWLNLGDTYSLHAREGAPRKSLVAVPERVLLALIVDGWTVRNKIVWAKTNPIPSSVRDRLSCTYEVIYLLARQPRYYFDLDAVRQPHRSKRGTRPQPRRSARRRASTRPPARRDPGRPSWRGPNADGDQGLTQLRDAGLVGHPLGKNPGDVWRLPASSYRGAHFATYPEALAARMLLAGCPEQRCTTCRAPWTRPVRRLGATAVRLALTVGCNCDSSTEPGLVLDPFLGAGTTAVAAERHGRDWLGIELNPEYADLARRRIATERSKRAEQSSVRKRKEGE